MIKSVEQADGSTLVHDHTSGKTFRFPSFEESIRNMSEDEIYLELAFGSVDAAAYHKELERRKEELNAQLQGRED